MFTLSRIAEITGGALHGDDLTIRAFETDTRAAFAPDSIFVAIDGPNFRGTTFTEEAIGKGAIAVLSNTEIAGAPCVVVDEPLKALQVIARTWREECAPTVIAVIGSNGKTIIKDMLAGMLSRKATTFRSPGSYNSQLGVALSLLKIQPEHAFAVIEAGISEVGEMQPLQQMVLPEVVIWSNVGDAHSAGLGTRENIAAEKAHMLDEFEGFVVFPSTEIAIINEVAKRSVNEIEDRDVDVEDFLQQMSSGFPVSILAEKERLVGFDFCIELVGPCWFSVNAPGAHNVINASLAARTAWELGVEPVEIRAALAAYESADLRLQMVTTSTGITLVNDTYNSDPTSARAALTALSHYGRGRRKVAVLGDMLDLGDVSNDAHYALGKEVVDAGVERLVAIGTWASEISRGAIDAGLDRESVVTFTELAPATHHVRSLTKPGDYVLVKGSRALGLERVASAFLDSVGPARLTVDLDAISENVAQIRRVVDPTLMMAVVKSFAYGNDATRVAQTLVHCGVSQFAVAYPDEAIPLRARGIDLPILVTNVFVDEIDKFARYDLTALISNEATIDEIGGFELDVHLEFESGMNRLGIPIERAVECAKRIEQHECLTLTGVMTHFAVADDPSEDEFTKTQIDKFQTGVRAMRKAGIDPGLVHAANTAAAWRFPESRFDMVRIGIGIYGVSPSRAVGEVATTVPALRFTTKIIDVRTIGAGESVGYGRAWRAQGETTVATIAVGYNDGFPRFMSNGGEVLIAGERCPVVGNVCMDATMVDVSGLSSVARGDEVVLFGLQGDAEISVDEIARRGNTISYEILTRVSPRVRRIFVRS